MKIILIDNSQKQFDGNSRDLPHLRGAELALINYAEELALIDHKVTVLNNCSNNRVINNVEYINVNKITHKPICDIAIVNSDANYFRFVNSKKNFLLSHSIQNLEKFIRHNQLLAFIKYKPIVLCFSNYHFNKRSLITSLFGKKIIIPSIDNDYFTFDIKYQNNQNAIFYSRFDRNGSLVINAWKEIFPKLKNKNKLYVNSDFSYDNNILKKYNIIKKTYLEKTKLINFLSNFRVLIIPGHKGEVFCNVAEEAKALCIPIVTMGIGALSERVKDNYNGFLCKNFDDFKNKIFNLLTNDEIYLRFRSNLIKDRGQNKWIDTTRNLVKLFD